MTVSPYGAQCYSMRWRALSAAVVEPRRPRSPGARVGDTGDGAQADRRRAAAATEVTRPPGGPTRGASCGPAGWRRDRRIWWQRLGRSRIIAITVAPGDVG